MVGYASNWKWKFGSYHGSITDGIVLRYCWESVKIPSTWACGVTFNVVHALYSPKGGCAHIRHKNIRNSFANLLMKYVMMSYIWKIYEVYMKYVLDEVERSLDITARNLCLWKCHNCLLRPITYESKQTVCITLQQNFSIGKVFDPLTNTDRTRISREHEKIEVYFNRNWTNPKGYLFNVLSCTAGLSCQRQKSQRLAARFIERKGSYHT